MRKAKVYFRGVEAGILTELEARRSYLFEYLAGYNGEPISMTMPVGMREFHYNEFPPFFDGLLPEGYQLEGLLKTRKIDRDDYFSQLMAVGGDMVGAVTVQEHTA